LVEECCLEALDVVVSTSSRVPFVPDQITATFEATSLGVYWRLSSTRMRREPAGQLLPGDASRSEANIANASIDRYCSSVILRCPRLLHGLHPWAAPPTGTRICRRRRGAAVRVGGRTAGDRAVRDRDDFVGCKANVVRLVSMTGRPVIDPRRARRTLVANFEEAGEGGKDVTG
jgi:hypothetical protein